jgi:UDP-3-O-[3-hydroxymyristoyl] glucosamine N-acyltransferase
MSDDAFPGDARFFLRAGPFPLARVVEVAGGELHADGLPGPAPDRAIEGVAPLQIATPGHVSFLDNRRYGDALAASGAGAVILHREMLRHLPAGCIGIVTATPYLGWARVAALFHPVAPARPGSHPAAVIDPAASVDPSAEIGPLAVIGASARIGPRCRIGPGAVIGAGVAMGADCRIGANASVECALLGDRVYVYPGARIGQEGFGFATGPAGFVTVPQLGRVIVGDDVEIGANSTVDRGSMQDTVIGAGTRIDNLVQVGHNVRVGRCCALVAHSAFAGSVVIEDFVQIGGQAGVAGHLRVGAKARVGAQSGVMNDIEAGADVVGSPAQPVRSVFRQIAALRKLAERPPAGRQAGAERRGGAGGTGQG